MKWINEKTVQGDPMDIKNYYIPKEDYNIPLVNEGIQEGRKLVFCKDCKYFMYGNGCFLQAVDCSWEEQMYADDFCSRGVMKDKND